MTASISVADILPPSEKDVICPYHPLLSPTFTKKLWETLDNVFTKQRFTNFDR